MIATRKFVREMVAFVIAHEKDDRKFHERWSGVDIKFLKDEVAKMNVTLSLILNHLGVEQKTTPEKTALEKKAKQ